MTAQWQVYLLECRDGSLYCGITNNLEHRLEMHNQGKASKYTRSRLPVRLAAVCPTEGRSQALKLEYRIKRLPKNQKIKQLNQENKKP